MNKKHFVICHNKYDIITETPTLEWAQENSKYFEQIPTTPMEVNRILVLNYAFTLIANDEKVICFKLL